MWDRANVTVLHGSFATYIYSAKRFKDTLLPGVCCMSSK